MANSAQVLHPSQVAPPEWTVSQQSIRVGSLTVEHQITPPSELSVSALTQHMLFQNLHANSNRQITRLGKEEYDGLNPSNSFFLAKADDTSGFWAWDGNDEAIMFAIDPLYFRSFAAEQGCSAPEHIELKNIVSHQDPQLEMLARQYHHEMQQGGLGGQLYSESLGVVFMLHLLRHYTHQQPKLSQCSGGLGGKRLKRVLTYINEHLEESIGLDELAAIAGLSKCHFANLFRQSIGMPPYRYVLIQRIELAKRLLRQDDLPINEIALCCGFADQSHLTKHFRKIANVTPRTFRER